MNKNYFALQIIMSNLKQFFFLPLINKLLTCVQNACNIFQCCDGHELFLLELISDALYVTNLGVHDPVWCCRSASLPCLVALDSFFSLLLNMDYYQISAPFRSLFQLQVRWIGSDPTACRLYVKTCRDLRLHRMGNAHPPTFNPRSKVGFS